MALGLATSARNAACNGIVDLLDVGGGAGKIEIRSGTRPATPNTAATGTLLATVTLAATAFGAAASGVATLADPAPVTGVAAGTATWFRAMDFANAAVFDGNVGATGSGADLELGTTTISVGLTVDVTGGTVTMPVGG